MVQEQQKHPLSNPVRRKKYLRDVTSFIQEVRAIPNPEELIEQEYHFDEGLGQSLQEHVEEI